MHTGRLAHGRLPLPCTALLAPCTALLAPCMALLAPCMALLAPCLHPARAFHRLPLARSLRARSAGVLCWRALLAHALPCSAHAGMLRAPVRRALESAAALPRRSPAAR